MTAQRILVTGGTGFIGRVLCPALMEAGYEVDVVSRQSPDDVRAICGRVTPLADISGIAERPGYDAVVNLAGEGIAEKRWSEQRKQVLRDSRIVLTRELVSALLRSETLPSVVVSGSAVGYYGDQGDTVVTEQTAPHDEFSHQLCADWEKAASPLADKGVRLCYSRTGLVVGASGGFLERMAVPFRLGLGGRIGDGRQYMPWVHRDDVVNGILWMLSVESANGAYNMASPNPVTNATFTRTLAGVLGRPALFPVPAAVLKLALGEMSQLLLTGQRAVPERLEQEGFRFTWRDLEPALKEALGK